MTWMAIGFPAAVTQTEIPLWVVVVACLGLGALLATGGWVWFMAFIAKRSNQRAAMMRSVIDQAGKETS